MNVDNCQHNAVIPAQAGIQRLTCCIRKTDVEWHPVQELDSRLRGNEGVLDLQDFD